MWIIAQNRDAIDRFFAGNSPVVTASKPGCIIDDFTLKISGGIVNIAFANCLKIPTDLRRYDRRLPGIPTGEKRGKLLFAQEMEGVGGHYIFIPATEGEIH